MKPGTINSIVFYYPWDIGVVTERVYIFVFFSVKWRNRTAVA